VRMWGRRVGGVEMRRREDEGRRKREGAIRDQDQGRGRGRGRMRTRTMIVGGTIDATTGGLDTTETGRGSTSDTARGGRGSTGGTTNGGTEIMVVTMTGGGVAMIDTTNDGDAHLRGIGTKTTHGTRTARDPCPGQGRRTDARGTNGNALPHPRPIGAILTRRCLDLLRRVSVLFDPVLPLSLCLSNRHLASASELVLGHSPPPSSSLPHHVPRLLPNPKTRPLASPPSSCPSHPPP
jgi:hypothetical protein